MYSCFSYFTIVSCTFMIRFIQCEYVGPPGCGKTSFAQVLAGELNLNICMLNLTHEGVNDNSLAEYLRDGINDLYCLFY